MDQLLPIAPPNAPAVLLLVNGKPVGVVESIIAHYDTVPGHVGSQLTSWDVKLRDTTL